MRANSVQLKERNGDMGPNEKSNGNDGHIVFERTDSEVESENEVMGQLPGETDKDWQDRLDVLHRDNK